MKKLWILSVHWPRWSRGRWEPWGTAHTKERHALSAERQYNASFPQAKTRIVAYVPEVPRG